MQCFSADHTLVTDLRELRRGVTPIAVGPQVFDLLAYLVQNRDRGVSKDDLFASVWGGRIVADSTLAGQLPLRDEGARERFFGSLAPRGPGLALLADRRLSLKRAWQAALEARQKY